MIVNHNGEEKIVEEHEIGISEHHSYSGGSYTTDYQIHGPKAVTQNLAEDVQFEFGVNVEDYGVEVIDPEDDDVEVL